MGLFNLLKKKTLVQGVFHGVIKKKNVFTGAEMKISMVYIFVPKEVIGDNCVYYYWCENELRDFSIFTKIYKLQQDEVNYDESQAKIEKLESDNRLDGSMTLFSVDGSSVSFYLPVLGGKRIHKGKFQNGSMTLSLFIESYILKSTETFFENVRFNRVAI